MCCTVFLSMWLSNTSTTAMVMPIAEAVLQQLICTGLADGNDDSETAEGPEDDSGTSSWRHRPTVASVAPLMPHLSDRRCSPQPSRRKETTWRRNNWSCFIATGGTPVDLLFRAEGSESRLIGVCSNFTSPSSDNCTKPELSAVAEVRAGTPLPPRLALSKRARNVTGFLFFFCPLDVSGPDWRGQRAGSPTNH